MNPIARLQKFPKPLLIWDCQKIHYRRLVDIYSKDGAYVDNSDTGTGKTPMTLAIAKTFDLNIFVVSPKSTLSNWRTSSATYGIGVIKVISYASLHGSEDRELNHEFLIRKGKEFYPTKKFKDAVRKGLLLVFDECQNIKNDNPQFAAAYALAKCVIKMSRKHSLKSGVALLSATPIDKKDHTISLLKMLGIITSFKLHDKNGALLGLQEAIDYARELDPQTTNFIASQPVNKASAYDILLELYVNVIKKYVSSALPPIITNKDAKNGYYDFPETDLILLKKGIEMLSLASRSCRSIPDALVTEKKKSNNITTALIIIEKAKTNTMVRLARQQLEADPNCKVLLYFKYLENINAAAQALSDYSPLKIIGCSTEDERTDDRAKFQANSNKYRVLISNPQVSGVGVELDDKFGGHERYMYMIPNYYFIDSHQTAGRICRAGSKSIGHIRFVYSKAFPIESSIINAMMRKNRVIRAVIDDPDRTIVLPGEYGIEIEGCTDKDEHTEYSKLWQT